MAQALQAPEDERDPVNQEDFSNTESGIDWSSSTSSSTNALFTDGPSADAKLRGPKDFLLHAERVVQALSSKAKRIAAADSASALRSALAPDDFAMRVMMSARRQAVERSVEHVRKLLAESACGEPGEECLCGWPVRSINEWGVSQDRILVLTTHALWRVHYVQEWAGVIEHHSRLSLGLIRGVRRRGAQGGEGKPPGMPGQQPERRHQAGRRKCRHHQVQPRRPPVLGLLMVRRAPTLVLVSLLGVGVGAAAQPPVDEARAEFVAPGAGVSLHFLVSAYDDGGLGVTVPVTVVVESAGPFVDVARGADDGDGTADRPFATIAAALATAAEAGCSPTGASRPRWPCTTSRRCACETSC
jgi:hypothetical protein